jgi:uncharacterized protein YggE
MRAATRGYQHGSGPSFATASPFDAPPWQAPAEAGPGAMISVAGFGTVRRPPELMRVVLSVEAVRERAAEAMAAVGVLADRLVAVARSAGIPAEDIQTRDLALTPERDASPSGVRVTGYRAGEAFQVTVRRLYYAGPTLELMADACPSQVRVEAVAFGVADQEELRNAARQAAYVDALSRADHYARLAGRVLGPLQLLDEQPVLPGPARQCAFSVVPAAVPAYSADLPSIEEQVTVQAVFAIH